MGNTRHAPPLEHYTPPSIRAQRRKQRRQPLRPGEAFAAGFYGGLGFWVAGIVLNIIAAILIGLVLIALGGVGALVA